MIVCISPVTAAFLTESVEESPHFLGRGRYFDVANLTTSAGDIVYKYFQTYPSVPAALGASSTNFGSYIDFSPVEFGFAPLLIHK